MHEVNASSLTAMPPHTRSNSSCLVTNSCARSANMASTATARGVSLISTPSRQSSPARTSKRNRSNANFLSADICGSPSNFPEISRNSPSTSQAVAARFVARGHAGRNQRENPVKTNCRNGLAAIALLGLAQPAAADVITDWNERAMAFVVARNMGPPPAERVLAMTHAAMFDAVNSIERKYRPYLVQLPADATVSKEAAAAAAAGTILTSLGPQMQPEMKAALATYLQSIPDSDAKTAGIKLGEAVAAKVLEARTNDGAAAPDSYRTSTSPGAYVPTVATWAPHWPGVKPFTLTGAAQFRPAAPLGLTSPQWAADYNEIKALGR